MAHLWICRLCDSDFSTYELAQDHVWNNHDDDLFLRQRLMEGDEPIDEVVGQ